MGFSGIFLIHGTMRQREMEEKSHCVRKLTLIQKKKNEKVESAE